ncbi:Cys-tRNA(Pro) deacylase [Knoellia sp. S7-12]|uniref:Cys-tRNA(Pro) deacylase n=1 Tax=Knoellia sp. S7-12 TaxID=3126698 RepID=UPI0033672BCA
MERKVRGGSVGTPATVALTKAKIVYAVRAYQHDPAAESFGLEAAQALGVEPARVFKTLLVSTGTGLAVGIVPVDRTLDLKAMASTLGVKKVAMADPVAAERSSGYVLGGISPVGQKRLLPTVVDVSAFEHETILVSGGRRGLDIELSPEALVTVTQASHGPIAR